MDQRTAMMQGGIEEANDLLARVNAQEKRSKS
jgi:hypothetical protein